MIPMVSPVRLPEPDLIVSWNGTIDRQWAVAQQRQPVPVGRQTYDEVKRNILAVMATKPGKVWLMRELVNACIFQESAVYRAVAELRKDQILVGERIGVSDAFGHGRQLRVWIAR